MITTMLEHYRPGARASGERVAGTFARPLDARSSVREQVGPVLGPGLDAWLGKMRIGRHLASECGIRHSLSHRRRHVPEHPSVAGAAAGSVFTGLLAVETWFARKRCEQGGSAGRVTAYCIRGYSRSVSEITKGVGSRQILVMCLWVHWHDA